MFQKKRKRNMYNFASTIKSKHEYKILPCSKPKVLQRKTELSRIDICIVEFCCDWENDLLQRIA